MRCLYCGNELALLKKLTGYGEFCSEAHRQKYQEQYNRLALTRLLQAQDAEPERRPPLSRTSVRPSSTLGPGKPRREIDTGTAPDSKPIPTPPGLRPPTPTRNQEPPEIRGFLPHPFEPAVVQAELASEGPILEAPSPSLPPVTSLIGAEGQILPDASLDKLQHTIHSVPPGPLSRPLDLELARVPGALILNETVVPFESTAEYEHTIGEVLSLATDPEVDESQADVKPAKAAPRVIPPKEPGRNGSSHSNGVSGLHHNVEPDASLFEPPVHSPKPADTRPPVVINFAALGIIDPEFEEAEKPKEVSAPVSTPEPGPVPPNPLAVAESFKAPEPTAAPTKSSITEPFVPIEVSAAPSVEATPVEAFHAPAVKAPAVEVVEAPALRAPVVEVSEAPVEKPLAVEVAEAPALRAPLVEVSKAPVEKPLAVEVSETPAGKVPAEQVSEQPPVKTAAAQVSEAPAEKAPAVQLSETLALKAPAVGVSKAPAEKPLAMEVSDTPALKAPAVEVSKAPAEKPLAVEVSETLALKAPPVESPAVEVSETPSVRVPAVEVSEAPPVDFEPAAPVLEEPPPLREKIPVLCSSPRKMDLRLANDAFTPVDDAAFDTPLFEVRTPTVATCPLRPKVVFGPSPIVPVPEVPEGAPALAGEPESSEATPGGAALEPSVRTTEFARTPLLATGPTTTDRTRAEEHAQTTEAAPVEQPPLKSRISELTTKLREQRTTRPATLGSQPPSPPAPPSDPVNPVELIPPAAEKPVDSPAGARSRASLTDLEALREEMERQAAPTYAKPPKSRRVAVLVALILAILLLAYLLREAFAAKTDLSGAASHLEAYGPALMAGEGGWTSDWAGPNAASIPGRQLEMFRPSLTMSDYRFEFQGKIEGKALGWVFRAINPRNYYAMKLQIAKQGETPKVTLSRMAVINGEETQKTQTELGMKIEPGSTFQVRTDVLGSTFRTYVQNQLADTWIDDRLKIGGVGVLKDQDEMADVRLVQLHGLRVAN